MSVAQIAGFRIFFEALFAGLIAPRGKVAAGPVLIGVGGSPSISMISRFSNGSSDAQLEIRTLVYGCADCAVPRR